MLESHSNNNYKGLVEQTSPILKKEEKDLAVLAKTSARVLLCLQ